MATQQLHLGFLVLEVMMPQCLPAIKLQVLQSIGRRQLKPYKHDTLNVFQASHSPPHAYICFTRSLDRAFIISEHGPTAEQFAMKLRSTLIEKIRMFNPMAAVQGLMHPLQHEQAYRASNYVARALLISPTPELLIIQPAQQPQPQPSQSESASIAGSPLSSSVTSASTPGQSHVVDLSKQHQSYVDIFEMSEELKAGVSSDGTSLAALLSATLAVVFDAEEYPGLVWIEAAPSRAAALQAKHQRSQGIANPTVRMDDTKIRTVIYPSGMVITHGTDNPDALLETYQRKQAFLNKFIKKMTK